MGLPDFSEWADRCDKLQASLDNLTTALAEFPRAEQQHSKQLREWEPFELIDGGTTDGSGNCTVGGGGSNLLPAANGWEAYIHRVSVTVQGASAAATVANYAGGASDQNLFDFANAMLGNSPSRIVGGYIHGVYSAQGKHATIVVAGAAASSGVIVRIEGRRRQV